MFVKTLDGKTIIVNVVYAENVKKVKEMIKEKEGIAIEMQRLIFAAKQLEDPNNFNDYNIQNMSTLHLVVCLFGGFSL